MISPEQTFIIKVVRAGRAWRRTADGAAADFGLTEATARPLLFLSQMEEPPRQAALAEAMHIERPSLVWLLDQLVQLDFVERHDDPGDRRGKTVHLTRVGRIATNAIQKALERERKKIFASIKLADLQAAFRVLDAFESVCDGKSSTRSDE